LEARPKLMIVLGSGGHTAQMIRLTEMLHPWFDFEYVINDDDEKSVRKIKFPGDIRVVHRPRRKNDKSVARTVFLTILSVRDAFGVVRNSEAVGIVSAGPGLAVPLFLWAGVFRKKRIFIESWSRVTRRSAAGRLCYYLSDLFFIQWPELAGKYPRAIYAGRFG